MFEYCVNSSVSISAYLNALAIHCFKWQGFTAPGLYLYLYLQQKRILIFLGIISQDMHIKGKCTETVQHKWNKSESCWKLQIVVAKYLQWALHMFTWDIKWNLQWKNVLFQVEYLKARLPWHSFHHRKLLPVSSAASHEGLFCLMAYVKLC